MKIKIIAPATSANLGPGFDFLGAALNLYNTYIVEETNASNIKATGFNVSDKDNYVIKGYKSYFEYFNKKEVNVSITELERCIPIARGLGSSSAALAAGLIAASTIDNNNDIESILPLAVKLEGHPDNIIPCLVGGLTTSLVTSDKVIYQKLDVNKDLVFNLFIPKYLVKTSDARKILPDNLSRNDLLYNASRVIQIPDAIKNGDINLLKVLLSDVVHEPFRKKLIKEYDLIKNALIDLPATFNISGSGSTMISITKKEDSESVIERVKSLNLDIDIKTCKASEGIKIETL